MVSSNRDPLSPSPKAFVVKGYRIQSCSGECGGIPISMPLSTQGATRATRSRSYSLTLNEMGTARNMGQVKTLGEAVAGIAGAVNALSETYQKVLKPHGDINPNVIILNKHGVGVLIDWDNNYIIFNMMRSFMRGQNYGQKKSENSYFYINNIFNSK